MLPGSQKPIGLQTKNNVGSLGESIAVSYLIRHNFRILERNFKARYGEIDIIALEGNTLVFVEVKTRTSKAYGSPADAVTPRKLHEVVQTAYLYTKQHPDMSRALRIDVIAILLDPSDNHPISIELIKNVTGG